MACAPLEDIEELALCSYCQRPFDDTERAPKILACKHHFCLACTRGALAGGGHDVRCAHCRKLTDLPAGRADALPTHAAVLALARRLAPDPPCAAHSLPALWCAACGARACRACDHHHAHALRPPREARSQLRRDAGMLLTDLQRLAVRQREFLLRALDAATSLKVRLETELAAPMGLLSTAERALLEIDYACGSLGAVTAERDRLRTRHAEALLQCKLDDLICNASIPLDFDLMRKALSSLGAGVEWPASSAMECRDPILFLANYCTAQLYTRHCLARRARFVDGVSDSVAATLELDAPTDVLSEAVDTSPGATSVTTVSNAVVGSPLRNPMMYPLFFFNLEVNKAPFGRVVIEVREDIAPRMSRNFSVLTTGELGIGYRGCSVFQCWENESIITGDFELNNGRGGRSVYEESFFLPDETKLVAVRGTVGMRRSQKRHDNMGMVGSQFRIILREMRGFTAIFAFVVEGLELVDRLSRTGDSTGKPHSNIIIASCGKLN